LDGADRTSITGTSPVTAWRDKSGNGNNATATGSPALTQNAINGVQAISTAVGTYFLGPVSITGSTLTCFAVATTNVTMPNVRSPRTSQRLVSLANGANRDYAANGVIPLFNQDNTSTISIYKYTDGTIIPSNPIQTNIPFLAVTHFDGTTASLWFNGSPGTVPTNPYNINFNITKYGIGEQANPDNGENWSGFFGEIILFNTALTTPQRQQVEGYLAAKWGLGMNLPTTHPYSSVIPILPTQIPGCQLWLDAADTSTITGTPTVTEWRDKSGNGYHMNTLQPNGAYTSVYPVIGTTINGLNTVFFSAYAGLTQAVTLSGVKNFYWVGRISRSGTSIGSCYNMLGHNSFYDWHGGNYGTGLYLNSFAENGIENATPVSIYGGNTAVVNTTFKLLQLPTEGTVNIISAAGITEDATTRYQGICYDRDNQQTGWVGDVAEAIVFNRALTTAQHQQVEQYLGRKWGIGVTNTTVAPGRYLIPTNRHFYPTDIPGCSLWLDGGDRTSMTFSSGTSVSSWRDKSGTGNNFTGSATYALSSFNNKFGLAFDGTNNYFNQASGSVFSITNTTYCIFTVHHFTTNGGPERTVYRTAVPNPGAFFRQISGGVQWLTDLDPAGYISRTASGEANSGINCINAITTTSVTAYLNGTSVGSSSKGSSTNMTFMVGQGTSGGTERLLGTIFEMIIFNNTLTTAQQQQVEQYLAWKWGISIANLPTGHPGKLLPAFSTNFTPKSVAGMQLWLDGADTTSMVFSGTTVTTWRNKSGNAGDAIATGSPTSTGSGVVFPNTGIYFTLNTPYASTHTIYIVCTTTVASQAYLFGRNYPSGAPAFITNYTGSSLEYFDDLRGRYTLATTPTSTFIASYIRTFGTSLALRYNGSQVSTQASPTTSENTSINWGYLGSATTTAGFYSGTIYEFMIFNAALTIPQAQQVEGYLAWKWGLQSSLPSTHAYAKFSP
jgi:hypothetical protein